MLNLKIRCFVHIYSSESFISVVNNTNATYVGFVYLASLHFERTVVCCLLAADFYWNCNLRHVNFLRWSIFEPYHHCWYLSVAAVATAGPHVFTLTKLRLQLLLILKALLADETKVMVGNLYFGLLYIVLDIPLLVSLRWGIISSVLKMLQEVGKC
jgi:hypothetical protein